MSSEHRRACWLRLLATAVVASTPVASAEPPTTTAPAVEPPVVLSSLGRLLKRFDFEEAERAPYTMPFNFYRYLAPSQGFPRFGTMTLSRTAAHDGRWSFLFELDGGSMSARVPTAVIPVMPGADYTVSAWVRTEGMTRAGAQIVAQLYDIEHEPIAESRSATPPMRTGGRWQHVTIEIQGNSDSAANLVLELQLLQPQQQANQREGALKLEDLTGRTWFDDITVWQEPRIELSTGTPGNIVVAPQRPELHVLIRDPTAEDLTARIVVQDLDGHTVREQDHVIPRGSWSHTLDLEGIDNGWYRALVEVRNDDRVVGRGNLDLVVLDGPPSPHPGQTLGVVLPPSATAESVVEMSGLVEQLGVAGVMLPVPPQGAVMDAVGGRSVLQRAGAEMLARDVEMTVALPGLSRELTLQDTIDRQRVQELIKAEDGLTDLLMSFGLKVPRWLLTIGVDEEARSTSLGSAVLLPDDELRLMVDSVAEALTDFVPDPIVLVPWSAEYELAPLPSPHGYWINVPTFIRPEMLLHYAALWPIGDRPLYTTIERLDANRYAPDQRVADLMLRALWGWRAGLPRMAITAPWSRRGPHGSIVPDPAFAVWRALADRLDGRRFVGELPVAEGVRCWILSGPGPDETALVAWNERADPREAVLSMLLSKGDVLVVDAFGNTRPAEIVDGMHRVPLGPRPLFVEGVDTRLVAFRAAFRISPAYLTARHQVHEGDVLIGNPWQDAISGTIRLRPPDGWRITPRIHEFTIPSGGELKLPISLVFGQGMLTGPTFAEAQVDLVADRGYRLNVRAPLEVGMKDLEFIASWRLDGVNSADLLIDQSVTNTGDRPLTLTAYVSAPGMSRQRRSMGRLQPNQTTTRTFRLRDGATTLAGRTIRLGVIDESGARLNRALKIPERVGRTPVSVTGVPDGRRGNN